MILFNYIGGIFKGVKTLLEGMKVTTSYFFRPWKIVTQKYPENREDLEMFASFKGEVIMPHNENNEHRCTGCGVCEINCPNGSIEILTKMITDEDGKSKRGIDKHVYHLDMCTFCGLCVKTCPSKALAFGNEFEHAVYGRDSLTKILNKEGSQLMKGVK